MEKQKVSLEVIVGDKNYKLPGTYAIVMPGRGRSDAKQSPEDKYQLEPPEFIVNSEQNQIRIINPNNRGQIYYTTYELSQLVDNNYNELLDSDENTLWVEVDDNITDPTKEDEQYKQLLYNNIIGSFIKFKAIVIWGTMKSEISSIVLKRVS